MVNIAIIIIAGILGAISTFYVNNKWQLGGVLASAGISIIAGGFCYIFPDILGSYLTKHLPLVIMGSSFIGMATARRIKHYWIIGISGLFFAVIYLLTGSFFEDFGGSLGTTAAIALFSVYALNQITNKNIFYKT